MTTSYLIAHLVRGEPAFDIAIQLEGEGTPSDPGPWWIMPSTGHRCYPYWTLSMRTLGYNDGVTTPDLIAPPPEDHPDFCGYEIAPADAAKAAIAGNNLLRSLGLLKPKPPITRRY